MARLEAICILLVYANHHIILLYQMDVKSAFLNGKIEQEVYVAQPPGFEDPKHPDMVYKLNKALCHHVTIANLHLIQIMIQIQIQSKVKNSYLSDMKSKMFILCQIIP